MYNIKKLIELDFSNLKKSDNISKYNFSLSLLFKYQIVLEHKINSFISFYYIDKDDFKNFDTDLNFNEHNYFENIECYISELTELNLNINFYKEQIKLLNVHPNIKKEIRISINKVIEKIKFKCREIDIQTISEFKHNLYIDNKIHFVHDIIEKIKNIHSWKKIISKIENMDIEDENLEKVKTEYFDRSMKMKQEIYRQYNMLFNNKIKWYNIEKLKNIVNMKDVLIDKIMELKSYYNNNYWKLINIIKHQKLPKIEFENDIECSISFDHIETVYNVNFEHLYKLTLDIIKFQTN